MFTVLIFTSCKYEFAEDYFKEIEITQPTASISLLNFTNGQTFKKYTDINFKYEGDNKHRLFEIKVYINNSLINTFHTEEGSFPIDIFSLDEGSHKLKIEYYFSSGTGSIADYYNTEAYKTTENLTFIIDKSVADAFSINKVEIVDGSLYIYWDDVTNNDFDEAYLGIKKNGFVNSEILLSNSIILSKVYNDNINTSGNLSYYIKVKNSFNSSISQEKSIEIKQPEITREISNFNKIKISWQKHPLYNNFDYYFFDSFLNNYQRIKLNKNGGDLTIDKDLVFGEEYHFSLRLIRERPHIDYVDAIGDTFSIGQSFEKKYCRNYIFNPHNNKIYALEVVGPSYYQAIRNIFIHELNPEDLTVLKSTQIMQTREAFANLSIDVNFQNLIIDLPEKSVSLDINTYNNTGDFYANDYLTNLPYWFYSYNRNNTFVIYGLSNSDSTYVFNSTTKQLIKTFPNKAYFFKISNDGRYIAFNDAIYKVENNNITKLTSTSTGKNINSLEFSTDNSKCFYTTATGTPVLYDFNTNSETSLNELKDSYHLSFDDSTNKLLSYQQYSTQTPFMEVLDLNTQEKKSIRIQNIHYTNTYYTLENNKIIFSPGKYLELK